MKLAWLTDIHLNFIDENARQRFYEEIIGTQCDVILISGDIAEAVSVASVLNEMATAIKKPIYFVLGNHDYYGGQINEVRRAMKTLTETHGKLFWLPVSGVRELCSNTLLIGQDGWADGRLGDFTNSRVVLNDSRMIGDLFQEKILGKYKLLEKMQQLADADARSLRNDLELAVSKNPKKIIVLTHVPPFKDSCLHEGKISNDDWLPYFSSKVVGDILTVIAKQNSEIDFLVLCGHTHAEVEYHPFKNMIVKVGSSEYCYPKIQSLLSL